MQQLLAVRGANIHKNIRKVLLDIYFRYLDASLASTPKNAAGATGIPDIRQDLLRTDIQRVPATIFACCDAQYYTKYARAFLGSVFSRGPHCPVHLHLINPTSDIMHELETLYARTEKFSATWETVTLSSLSEEQAGIYYYTIRFLRLKQFFESTGSACLCLDIDALINRDGFQALLEELVDFDLAFYSRFNKFGCNTKLLAGTLFVNNTPPGQHFLDYASKKIERFLSAGHLLEKMDQQILYNAYLDTMKRFSPLRFKDLKYPIIDLEFTESGMIWYPKGGSKHFDRYLTSVKIHSQKLSSLLQESCNSPR